MNAKYLTLIPALFMASSTLANDVVVSPNVRHHKSEIEYERHAERLNFDGVRCTAVVVPMKSDNGGYVARKSVDCQE